MLPPAAVGAAGDDSTPPCHPENRRAKLRTVPISRCRVPHATSPVPRVHGHDAAPRTPPRLHVLVSGTIWLLLLDCPRPAHRRRCGRWPWSPRGSCSGRGRAPPPRRQRQNPMARSPRTPRPSRRAPPSIVAAGRAQCLRQLLVQTGVPDTSNWPLPCADLMQHQLHRPRSSSVLQLHPAARRFFRLKHDHDHEAGHTAEHLQQRVPRTARVRLGPRRQLLCLPSACDAAVREGCQPVCRVVR